MSVSEESMSYTTDVELNSSEEDTDLDALAAAQHEAEAMVSVLEKAPEETSSQLVLLEVEKTKVQNDSSLSSAEKERRINQLHGTSESDRKSQLDTLLLRAKQFADYVKVKQDENVASQIAHDEAKADKAAAAASAGKRKSSDNGDSRSRKRGKKQEVDDGTAFNDAAEKMAKSRAAAEEAPAFCQPKLLTGGTLKGYQLEGLRWLISLYENGLSGILADEMGLGKTIQVIALLAHLRGVLHYMPPILIAAPLATLPNWVSEVKKWAPELPVLLYHGNKQHRQQLRAQRLPLPSAQQKAGKKKGRGGAVAKEFPIVITSYEVCIADRTHLQRYNWSYLIVDEGQRVKNVNCRLVRELSKLRSESRLLLSGTPIQNTLEELWSLMHFVNPSIFDSFASFEGWFGAAANLKGSGVAQALLAESQDRIVSKLHDIVRPFLLRRTKLQVLGRDEMPPKREIVVYAGTTSLQQQYLAMAEKGQLRQALMKAQLEHAKEVSLSNVQMVKRKVCLHPFLYGEPRNASGMYVGVASPEILVKASGKMMLLDRLMRPLHAGGHKVLIFSQMTQMLNILSDYVQQRGWRSCRIDGSVEVHERQRLIDEFNNDPDVFVFLLSTRAGGLGINLTAADTCIIYDSDWNPQQDSQAQDRCHRIGQTRPVVVYRLITAGTVEVEMLEKQVTKRKLERMTVAGGDFRKAGQRSRGELTVDMLKKLLTDDVADLTRRTLSDGEDRAIDDEELGMILDRSLVFSEERHEDEDKATAAAAAAAAAQKGSEAGGSGATHAPKATVSDRKCAAPGNRTTLPREGKMYDVVEVASDVFSPATETVG